MYVIHESKQLSRDIYVVYRRYGILIYRVLFSHVVTWVSILLAYFYNYF